LSSKHLREVLLDGGNNAEKQTIRIQEDYVQLQPLYNMSLIKEDREKLEEIARKMYKRAKYTKRCKGACNVEQVVIRIGKGNNRCQQKSQNIGRRHYI
jgi:hypothetical protein